MEKSDLLGFRPVLTQKLSLKGKKLARGLQFLIQKQENQIIMSAHYKGTVVWMRRLICTFVCLNKFIDLNFVQ